MTKVSTLFSKYTTAGSGNIFYEECQSARMSKITNDDLTRSVTECFIAVPI